MTHKEFHRWAEAKRKEFNAAIRSNNPQKYAIIGKVTQHFVQRIFPLFAPIDRQEIIECILDYVWNNQSKIADVKNSQDIVFNERNYKIILNAVPGRRSVLDVDGTIHAVVMIVTIAKIDQNYLRKNT